MNFYEHTIIARQDISPAQLKQVEDKYKKVIESNEGNLLKNFLKNGVQVFTKYNWFEYELNCLPVELLDSEEIFYFKNFFSYLKKTSMIIWSLFPFHLGIDLFFITEENLIIAATIRKWMRR